MNGKPFSHSPKPAKNTHIDADKYVEMYANSIADPAAFWGEHGKRIDWIKPYTTVKDVSFVPRDIRINWYSDGTLNVSANCIDRHLETRGDQAAIIWEPDQRSNKSPVRRSRKVNIRNYRTNSPKMESTFYRPIESW